MSKCEDDWTGEDKVKHFMVCFALAALCPPLAVVIAAGKELHDMHERGNHWCWKDMAVDVAGILAGMAVKELLLS